MLSVVSNIVPSTDASSFKSVLSRDDISIDSNFTGFASREYSLNRFRRVSMSEVKFFFQSVPYCYLHRKGNCISIIERDPTGIEKNTCHLLIYQTDVGPILNSLKSDSIHSLSCHSSTLWCRLNK